MKRKKQGTGFQLGDKLYLGNDTQDDLINLKLNKGDIMQYGDHGGKNVEFPGDYDVQGISITCVEAGDSLNYVIRAEGEQCAIVQDKSVFDVTNFEAIDKWLVMSEDIQNEIENLELEGDIEVLA